MAGPLLRILLRLQGKTYRQMQIAARYRVIDLFKQIAHDLHLSIDQLLHVSIYRRGPNGCYLVYPFNKTYSDTSHDVSVTLDTYSLTSADELVIDISDLMPYEHEQNDDNNNEHFPTNTSLPITKTSLTNMGQLTRYSVPADNSCLFTSIHFVLHNGKFDVTSNKYLRHLVAKTIESNHDTYSEAILGRTNADYCQWICRG
jgi:hypothetical protein